MIKHLPECRVTREFAPIRGADLWAAAACICPSLRACEQRVLSAERGVVSKEAARFIREYAERTHQKHSIQEGCARCDLTAALLALAIDIDALKEERSGNPDVPPSAEKPLLCGECGTEMWPSDVGCLHLADDDDPGHTGTLDTPDALREVQP